MPHLSLNHHGADSNALIPMHVTASDLQYVMNFTFATFYCIRKLREADMLGYITWDVRLMVMVVDGLSSSVMIALIPSPIIVHAQSIMQLL